MKTSDDFQGFVKSPIGTIKVEGKQGKVSAIGFVEKAGRPVNPQNPALKKAVRQLEEYFAGKRKDFQIPFDCVGTEFQNNVWKAIAAIPHGKVSSYSDIATRVRKRKAVRACGTATGRNPLMIVIPCHRVIGMGGRLGGYAYGVERKQWLLRHEGSPVAKK